MDDRAMLKAVLARIPEFHPLHAQFSAFIARFHEVACDTIIADEMVQTFHGNVLDAAMQKNAVAISVAVKKYVTHDVTDLPPLTRTGKGKKVTSALRLFIAPPPAKDPRPAATDEPHKTPVLATPDEAAGALWRLHTGQR